jgi:hypothetical protein
MHSTLRQAAVAVGLAAATLTSPTRAAEPAASMVTSSHFGSWGFDLSGRDLGVAPGADF